MLYNIAKSSMSTRLRIYQSRASFRPVLLDWLSDLRVPLLYLKMSTCALLP
jgi:hypothetical protein